MARPRRIDPQLVRKALEVSQQTQDCQELREALAVLLPAETNATLDQTARILGLGRATVARYQRAFKDWERSVPRKVRGGRRRSLMSVEAEKEFFAPVGGTSQNGESLGAVADPGSLGAKVGP